VHEWSCGTAAVLDLARPGDVSAAAGRRRSGLGVRRKALDESRVNLTDYASALAIACSVPNLLTDPDIPAV